MSNFKLVAVGSIKATLVKAVDLKRNTTISALFHGLVNNNVSFVTGMRKEDMADFDSVLRPLLPVAWDAKNDCYVFSDKRAGKSAEKLDMPLYEMRQQYKHGDKASREEMVQEFFGMVMAFYNANQVKVKTKEISPEEIKGTVITKIKNQVKAAKDAGVSDTELLDVLAGMGIDVTGYVAVLER